jgi:tetratricopeptide (TPR) repeat protein
MACRHELGNLRTALDWAFSPDGDRGVGIALAAVAVPCLLDLSLVDECCERARIALNAMSAPAVAPVSTANRLSLLAAYGAALFYTQGPVQAVDEVWGEVLSLAVAASDAEYELRAVWGLWSAHQYRGETREALKLARRFGALARMSARFELRLTAQRTEAIALFYAGDLRAARARLEQMLPAYAYADERWGIPGFPIEDGIVARTTLARVLWAEADAGEALRVAQCALQAALDYGRDVVLCHVLVEGLVPIALMSGAFDLAREGIALLRARATLGGFVVWLACCDGYDEYLRSVVDPNPARAPAFRAALDAVRETGYLTPWTMLLAQYARLLSECGRREEARAALEEAMHQSEGTGGRRLKVELGRVQADISA